MRVLDEDDLTLSARDVGGHDLLLPTALEAETCSFGRRYHLALPSRRRCRILATANTVPLIWLHMQAPSEAAPAAVLDQLVNDTLPDQRGLAAWLALLRAHASLMRELATDLVTKTGLTLGDFDVLAQLALAGGELRMTDLAARAFSSRSSMTRRVDRLVDEGLVQRSGTKADARSVVIAVTDAGLARLRQTVPVHLRKVSELFIERLDDQELAILERALDKVTPACSFG
ncbi:MAG: MarR family transcriptional regulator [Chloroflexota bacterium]|nr:MarR family transcriptional regulator [Chloroflexota bacterium]